MFQQNSDDKDSYIYFLAYVNKRAALTVIELSHVVSYERDEFDAVDDNDYHNPIEAIYAAKAMIKRAASRGISLSYDNYSSRYWNPSDTEGDLTSPDRNEMVEETKTAIMSTFDEARFKAVCKELYISYNNKDQAESELLDYVDTASNQDLSIILCLLQDKIRIVYEG